MSADGRGDGRKTLLPEFLPTPAGGVALTPQQRVAERARLLLQRFRGLGTAAGAAVLSLQCSGYGVVDPLPPPPMQCTVTSNPFANLHVMAMYATGGGRVPPVRLVLSTSGYPPGNYVGFRIDAVRVTGGALVSVDDLTSTGQGGSTRFEVVVESSNATGDVFVDVDFGCGTAVTTKRYQIVYRVPDSLNEAVVVTEVVSSADAGTD